MFKKIHSKRDPEDTFYTEVRKEFAPVFQTTEQIFGSLLKRYPKQIFFTMVAMMCISFILSFTLFRNGKGPPGKQEIPLLPANHRVKNESRKPPPNDGISGMMEMTSRLMLTLHLKQQIEGLINKRPLSQQDSTVLLNAIDSLDLINKPINTKQHEH